MKKLLSLALAVMLLAGTVVVAFAEADGTPLTLDVSTLSKYIYLGPEKDYYDEDGYVLTGVKEDAGVSLYVDSNLTFSDLKILDLDTRDDAKNISITIDGKNEIIDRIHFRDENFVFNAADEDATLIIPDLNAYGGDSKIVWNGGNLVMEFETDGNRPTLDCGLFTQNSGHVTISNNYYYPVGGDITLNGGRMDVICTALNREAIDGDVVMNTGALLTAEAPKGVFYHMSTFSKAEGLGADYSFFVRFDTDSEFTPVADVKKAMKGKTYAELKVDYHKHQLENNTCICGFTCLHTDFENGLCTGCGYGLVAEEGAAVAFENNHIVIGQGMTAEQLIAMANDAAVLKNADGTDLEAGKNPGTGATLTLDSGVRFVLVVIGDVDGDGEVSSIDARNTLRNAAGLDEMNEAQLKAADYNADGSVTSADARSILRKAVGLPDENA